MEWRVWDDVDENDSVWIKCDLTGVKTHCEPGGDCPRRLWRFATLDDPDALLRLQPNAEHLRAAFISAGARFS